MAELAGDLLEILIKGPSPFGFRLHGGDGDPLVVAKLRARGKSRGAGLKEGDVILGINGISCQNISHGIAMTLIETSKDLLRLNLCRGSTDQKSLSTAYGAIADQLRPASPGLTPLLSSILNIQPWPATGVESPFGEAEQLTPYSKQEVTSFVEANVTQTTTTETRHSDGGVTVTKEKEEEVKGSEGGTVPSPESDITSLTMFHVPKIKSQQPLRWAPKGATTSEPFQGNKSSITAERVDDKENLTPNKQMEIVELAKFSVEGQQQQQQQFKAAKQWVWQPTGLPEREPTLPTDAEVLDAPQESQPQQKLIEELLPQKRHTAEAAEGTGSGTPPPPPHDLSPHLAHILTTEGTSDDCTSHRKKKKIFADSSFYDEPEHKYPTIEEQIKMARQVALSLSTPDNVTAARGQQMFRKRKEKADDDGDDDDGSGGLGFPLPPSSPLKHGTRREEQLFYSPTPWRAQQAAKRVEAAAMLEAASEEKEKEKEDEGCRADQEAFARNRAVFAGGVDVQRREPPWKKKALSNSSTTAEDLGGTSEGRGAKLFAQKRAKALKEEEEQEEVGEGFGEGQANGFGKKGDHVITPADREEASKANLSPWGESKTVGQSRLMTPWQTTSAANDARERGTNGERSDDIPDFIAQKIPTLSYRPVKFLVA